MGLRITKLVQILYLRNVNLIVFKFLSLNNRYTILLKMTNLLFVYGTLMHNEKNEYSQLLKQHTQFISTGFIYAKKIDLGPYPGIKIDPTKTHKTQGELYRITKNSNILLESLDDYEGFLINDPENSLFIRKEIAVTTSTTEYKAWVYEYAKPL